ncbi:MAG: lectin-like protein, partial [Prosthecobacter sp.]|nr:lectin-like protein [Prosthecobacter sp.]
DRENRYQTALDLRRDLDVILTTPAAKTGMQTIPAQQVAAQRSLPQKPMGKSPGAPQQRSADAPIRKEPAARPVTTHPPKKSNAGMIYGIAAAVVVVAVAGFMFTGGEQKKQPVATPPVATTQMETTRPSPPPPRAPPPVPAAASSGWQPLFTEAEWRQSEPGKREWVNGQLRLLRMSKTKPWPSADGAIRARILFKDGSKNISLTARGMNADELYKLNLNNGSTIGLASIGPDGRTLDSLGKHVLPKPLQPGDTLLLELRLQGDRLTALVNGAVVIEARNSRYSAPGKWGILADDGWFESVEMQTLGTQTSIVSTPPPTSKPSDMLTFGGHRYRHLPDILSWTAAKAKAESMGGHLATITSKEENDWIKQNFITGLPAGTGVWLGATHDGVPGHWRWVTGEPFDFKGWGPGEPNDRPEELAISFARSDQGPLAWYDMRDSGFGNKDRRSGLLIEWDDDGQTKSPPLAAAPSTPGAINLLQDLVIGRDAIAGGWSMPGGELHSKGNTFFDRLAFSVPVPEEYDFRVEFTRMSGTRGVAQHLALPDGRDVMWLMGAFDNQVCTFEIVDGLPGDDNPSTVKQGVQNGRRYVCVVKVRKDTIRAEIDGKPVSEIRPASVKLAVFDKWKFTDAKKIGVGAQQPTVFHRVELIPVGTAQPSVFEGRRLASVAPPSAEPPASMRGVEPVSPQESDPRLAQLAAGFKARYEADAEKPYHAAVATLNQSYVANGIGRARAAAQQKGALEEVTALDAEKRRIENNEPLPPADLETLPESLKTLRATYRTALGKIEADRARKAAPLYDLYLGALDAYIAELTKGNKIDEAQKVKTLRETIATQKPRTDVGPATVTTGTPTRPGMSRPGTKPAPSEEDSSDGGRGSRWYDAARWVVSVGGSLRVDKNGESFIVSSEDKIPAGRFAILEVHLTGNPKSQGIRDDDFTRLSGLKELTSLNLTKIQATDTAFAFLPTTPNLTRVVLGGVPVTDAVLAHLAPLANLTELHIQDARQFTGAGLEKLASLPVLTSVWFSNSGLNDAGAKALLGGKNLEFVRLEGTPVTDEGVSGFGVLTKLTHINLSRCPKLRGT